VITKCDIADKERIAMILDSEGTQVRGLSLSGITALCYPLFQQITALDTGSNMKMKKLTQVIGCVSAFSDSYHSFMTFPAYRSVIDDYMMVSFVMLDVSDEDSIEEVLYRIDHCSQYGMIPALRR
jgi:hypothetical protein